MIMNVLLSPGEVLKDPYSLICNTASYCKEGLVEVSRVAAEMHTITGVHCLVKVISYDMFVLSKIQRMNDAFKNVLPLFATLNTLYYAAMITTSLAVYFKKDKDKDVYYPEFPRRRMKDGEHERDLGIDAVKICYSIGGICDTVAYLLKHDVLRINFFTKVANRIAQIELFRYKGQVWKTTDFPLLSPLSESLKEDPFIFAFFGECWRWAAAVYRSPTKVERRKQFQFMPLLKVSISFGRLVTLSLHRQFKGSKTLLAINGFVYHASLLGYILVKKKERSDALNRIHKLV